MQIPFFRREGESGKNELSKARIYPSVSETGDLPRVIDETAEALDVDIAVLSAHCLLAAFVVVENRFDTFIIGSGGRQSSLEQTDQSFSRRVEH